MRIAASPLLPDGLFQVRQMEFRDVYEAHVALDVLEDIRAREEEDRGRR